MKYTRVYNLQDFIFVFIGPRPQHVKTFVNVHIENYIDGEDGIFRASKLIVSTHNAFA